MLNSIKELKGLLVVLNSIKEFIELKGLWVALDLDCIEKRIEKWF